MDIHNIGQAAEERSCLFLIKKGLKLLEKNYQCKTGEIDLIMRDGNQIIFVEVRARTPSQFANAFESVNYYKQQKLLKTATHYLQKHRLLDKMQCRFDVIGITHDKIEWIQNAFTADNF